MCTLERSDPLSYSNTIGNKDVGRVLNLSGVTVGLDLVYVWHRMGPHRDT